MILLLLSLSVDCDWIYSDWRTAVGYFIAFSCAQHHRSCPAEPEMWTKVFSLLLHRSYFLNPNKMYLKMYFNGLFDLTHYQTWDCRMMTYTMKVKLFGYLLLFYLKQMHLLVSTYV